MIVDEIIKKIEEYDSIVIFGHVFPDGDCYGSQIALKDALSKLYPKKKIYAVGSGYQKMITKLGAMDEVSDEIIQNSLAIAVDFNEPSRSEDKRLLNAPYIILIDHHIPNKVFGDIRLVDTSKVACAEIISNIIMDKGWELSLVGYTALFLGITTDSGRFLFPPVTPSLLKIGAFLIEKGVNAEQIYNIIYESDEDSLVLKKHYYGHYERSPHGVIYIIFRKDEVKELGISNSRAAGGVGLLGNIKGYPIWMAAAEAEDGSIKVEVRSKDVLIQPICVAHTGGGHACAAGCTVYSIDEVYQIIDELDVLLKKE